jgi:hypothetical protein
MLGVLFVGPWLLVPLGLVGLLVAAPAARSGYVLWASFVPAYDALAVAVFYVSDRYQAPLLVALCVTGGAALDALVTALAARRWTGIAGGTHRSSRRSRGPTALSSSTKASLKNARAWPNGRSRKAAAGSPVGSSPARGTRAGHAKPRRQETAKTTRLTAARAFAPSAARACVRHLPLGSDRTLRKW